MRRVQVGDFAAAFGRHVVSILSIGATLAMVGRVLGAEALAQWSLLGSLAFAIGASDLGLTTAVQRAFAVDNPTLARATWGWTMRVMFFVGIIATLAAWLTTRWVLSPGGSSTDEGHAVVAVVLLGGYLQIPAQPLRGTLLVQGGIRHIAISRMLGGATQVLLSATWLYIAHRGLLSVALATFVGQLVEMLVLRRATRKLIPALWQPAARLEWPDLWFALREGAPSFAVNVSVLIATRIDLFVLARNLPLKELSGYGVASRLCDQATTLVKQGNAALLSTFRAGENLRTSLRAALSAMGAMAGAVFATIAVLGQAILETWVGAAARNEHVAATLPFLALAGFVACMSVVPASVLALRAHNPWYGSIPVFAGAICTATLTFLLCPSLGSLGAAASVMAGSVTTLLVALHYLTKLYGLTFRSDGPSLVPAIVSGGVALTVAATSIHVWPAPPTFLRMALVAVSATLGLSGGWMTQHVMQTRTALLDDSPRS